MIIVYDVSGNTGNTGQGIVCDGEMRGICAGSDVHHPECASYTVVQPRTPSYEDGPPADWLMVWMSGWMSGYATGYDHGHADGEQEYGAQLQAALQPMRRAAAHGIDVMTARRAWENQRRAGHGLPPLTGPLERGGDREPYDTGGGAAA